MPRTPRQPARLAALAFPVALWALATCFLLFELGKWNDDWWFSGRDPVTGRIVELTKVQGSPMWRPLHHIFTPGVITLLWSHDWAVHLIAAFVHGVCSLLVWRVLRSLGASRLAAAAGGLLFLCYPGHFEPVFWFAATSTAVATGLFLALTLMYIRWASGRGSWPALGGILLTALAVPCFNEQPLAGIAAWPIAWLVASRRLGDRSPSSLPSRRWPRMAAPIAACGLAGVAYIAANVLTLPKDFAGGAGSFTPFSRLYDRTAEVAGGMRDMLLMSRFRLGALLEGFRALADHPAAAAAWLAIILATGTAWAAFHRQPGAPDRTDSATPASRTASGASLLTACFGLAIFLADWLPLIAVEGYTIRSRMIYAPAAGLAIAIAGCLDAIAARRASRAPTAVSAAAVRGAGALVALSLVGAVAMVGVQRGFAERWRADKAEGAALRAGLPDPLPGSVFLPLRVGPTVLHSGSERFDLYFASPWELSWAAPNYVRFLYGRADLHGLWFSRWGQNIVKADGAGVVFIDPLPGGFRARAGEPGFVPWSAAVPFKVELGGVPVFATNIVVRTPGRPDLPIAPPQGARVQRGRRADGFADVIESP